MASSNGTTVGAAQPIRSAHCFRVEIPGITVGVFARCTGLEIEYEVMEYAEGGENGYVHKLRGATHYPNLLLSRGLTSETGLLDWMLASQEPHERPTVTVALLDELGEVQRSWSFSGAFPIRWVGPTLAGADQLASETLEIAHNGLLRD